MKKPILAILAAALTVVGCYDDSSVKEQLADHEKRISDLETICKQLNSDVASIQLIVNGLKGNVYVTEVKTLSDGYNIIFSNGTSATVKNGAKGDKGDTGAAGAKGDKGDKGDAGAAGTTPTIGVTQIDGVYYWTVNGQTIKDGSNNPIPVKGETGANGNDGITPSFKIEGGFWYVSYNPDDDEPTWELLGAATSGGSGSSSTTTSGISATVSATTVSFVIDGSSVITLPRWQKIAISFDAEEEQAFAGKSMTINYTITGGNDNQIVTASSDGNYKVKVTPADNNGGTLTIIAPDPIVDGFINVIVSDGQGYAFVKVLKFYEGKYTFADGYEFSIPSDGGAIEIPFNVNFDYTAEVVEGEDWLSITSTKAAMREASISVNAQNNDQQETRTAKINIYSDNNSEDELLSITLVQDYVAPATRVVARQGIGKISLAIYPPQKGVTGGKVSWNGGASTQNFTLADPIPEYHEILLSDLAAGDYSFSIIMTNNSGTESTPVTATGKSLTQEDYDLAVMTAKSNAEAAKREEIFLSKTGGVAEADLVNVTIANAQNFNGGAWFSWKVGPVVGAQIIFRYTNLAGNEETYTFYGESINVGWCSTLSGKALCTPKDEIVFHYKTVYDLHGTAPLGQVDLGEQYIDRLVDTEDTVTLAFYKEFDEIEDIW